MEYAVGRGALKAATFALCGKRFPWMESAKRCSFERQVAVSENVYNRMFEVATRGWRFLWFPNKDKVLQMQDKPGTGPSFAQSSFLRKRARRRNFRGWHLWRGNPTVKDSGGSILFAGDNERPSAAGGLRIHPERSRQRYRISGLHPAR